MTKRLKINFIIISLILITLLPSISSDDFDGKDVQIVESFNLDLKLGSSTYYPTGLVTNSSADVFYLADAFGNDLWRLNASFNNISAKVNLIPSIGSPNDIYWNNSDFWISDLNDDFVYHLNSSYDNQTGGFEVGIFDDDILSGNNSNLFLADTSAGKIGIQDYSGNNLYNLSCSDYWSCQAESITYYDGFFYILNRGGATHDDDTIDKLDSSGVYVTHRSVTNVGSGIVGGGNLNAFTTSNGNDFWIADYTAEYIYHVTFNDIIFPLIDIIYPSNNTLTSNTNLNVNYTVSDNGVISSCWYSNDTMTLNTTQAGCTNITTITWTEGQHNVTIWVNDTANNINSSSVTFTIDTINPLISIATPTNNTFTTNTNLNVNYTVTDAGGIDSCWYSKNSGVNNITINTTENIETAWWSTGNIADDTNYIDEDFDTYANFTNGDIYVNYTIPTGVNDASWEVKYDPTGGSLTFKCYNHTSGSFVTLLFDFTSSSIQQTNLTIPSGCLDESTLITDTDGFSAASKVKAYEEQMHWIGGCFNITTETWSEGLNTVVIWANDTVGNINSSSVTFTIDSIFPSISITYPQNNSNLSSKTLDINYTYVELNPDSCWWSNDSGTSNNSLASCGVNITGQTWDEGSNTIILWINDTLNNINSTSVTLVVDTILPDVSIAFPINTTNTTNTNLNVNYTASDTNLDSCWYSNDTFSSNTTLVNCANITTITWSEGSHTVIIWANDTVNNQNSSSVTFRIDTTPPVTTATMTSPPDGAGYTNDAWTKDNVKIVLDAVDAGVGFADLVYPKYCNDTTNTCTPDTYISSGVTLTSEGTNYIRYFSNDTLGNEETIQSRTIKIDETAPNISIVYPTSGFNFSYNESISLNFTYADSLSGMDSCWYNLNGGTNTTLTGCQNATINVSEGSVAINIYANDSVNNINNSESVTFNVDLTYPEITITFPENISYSTNISALNYTYVESNCNSVWYSLNGGTDNSTTYSCGTNFTSLTSSEGSNTWTIYMNDTFGNENSTSITFFKDTVYPTIDYGINTATDYANLSQNWIYVNTTWTETNFANITFALKNDTDTINSTTFTNSIYEINWTGLDDNNYTYFVNISDTLNNKNSTLIRRITIDTTNPNSTLIFPQNNSYNSTTSQNFTFNISDNLGIKNATLHIYNESGEYNITPTDFEPNLIQKTVGVIVYVIDGVYKWWVSLFDWSGNEYQTENYTITIDTFNPSITFNPSTYANATYRQAGDIFINVTASDTNKETVQFSWNGVNETFDNIGGDYYWENQTGLSEGAYTFYAWINDTVNNYNQTDTRIIYIDLNNPTVNILSPTASAYNYNESLNLNFTAADTYLDSCWYNLDGTTNISLPNCQNITFNTSEAAHILYLYANDSSGRESSDSVSFTVSLAPPGITLDYPADGQWLNTNNVYFNFTATDSGGVSVCELWTNSTGTWHKNFTWDNPPSAVQNYTVVNINDGGYKWNVWCNDTSNNGGWGGTNNYTFSVDAIYPLISYGTGTPANDLNTTTTSIYINVSVTELNEDSIVFLLHGSSGEYNKTSFTDGTRTINWTSLPDDTYTYNVTFNDSAGNTNTTETYTIRLDDTPPVVTIDEPKAQNYGYNDSLSLNYSITDNLIGIDECWYNIYNESNDLIKSKTTLSSCENTTFSVPEGDIDYDLRLYYRDNLENTDVTLFTFGVRTIAPAVVLYPLNNTHSNILTNHYFNFSVTTNADSIASCSLYGDFNGSYSLNQTITSPAQSTNINFSALDLTEGSYLWNVLCTDNFGTSDFALNNYTYVIDTTSPILNITAPTNGSSVSGLSTTIYYNISDLYSDSCFFTLRDSSGVIHNYAENTSLTCSENGTRSISTLDYGTFTFYLYGKDKAGNENSTQVSFTTVTSGGTTGGGGGSTTIEKVQVIALVRPVNSTLELTALQRSIVYKEINEIKRLVLGTFAVGLNDQDLANLKERLQNKGITMSDEELELWVEQFEQGKLDKVFLDKKFSDEFNLVLATGTYCGDAICQESGNDLGMKEGFYNCQQDCPAPNVDTATFYCFDKDPNTACIWDEVAYQYVGLFFGFMVLILIFSTIEDKKTGRQIPLYRYYSYKLKSIKGKRR